MVSLHHQILDSKECDFLFNPQASQHVSPSPVGWVGEQAWRQLSSLNELPNFKGICASFRENAPAWKKIFEREEPHEYKLPGVWRQRLDEFQFLLLLRVLRPNKLSAAIHAFVANLLGERFCPSSSSSFELPPLGELLRESSEHNPIMLIADKNMEDQIAVCAHAAKREVKIVQLGQGMNAVAAAAIEEAARKGSWVYLKDLHLSPPDTKPWLTHAMQGKPNRHFRLWISTLPSWDVPLELLEKSVKYVVAAPNSIRAEILDALETPFFKDPTSFN